MKAYYNNNPEYANMVNSIIKAGGRVKMESFFNNNAVVKFMKAWREGNYIVGTLCLPLAAVEMMAKPIMEYIVSRQKLGVFFDMILYIIHAIA